MSGSSVFRILFNEPISDLHGGGYTAYLACVSFVGSEEEWIFTSLLKLFIQRYNYALQGV